MSEATKKRLADLKAKKILEASGPGRGTLKRLPAAAWMGAIDELQSDGDHFRRCRDELLTAGIIVPFPVDGSPDAIRNLDLERRGRFSLEGDWCVRFNRPDPFEYSIEVAPRRIVKVDRRSEGYVDPNNAATTDVARVSISYLPDYQRVDLERVFADSIVRVDVVADFVIGKSTRTINLYPADKILILFRMLWFASADDLRAMQEQKNPKLGWQAFGEAVKKYLVAYSDEWVAEKGDGE